MSLPVWVIIILHRQHVELQEERDKIKKGERFAVRLSNICNMIIFVAKVLASVKSMSLAIIASTLDSFLDLLSGFILWFVTHSMRKRNPYIYPIGKKRMQPLVRFSYQSKMSYWCLRKILFMGSDLSQDFRLRVYHTMISRFILLLYVLPRFC